MSHSQQGLFLSQSTDLFICLFVVSIKYCSAVLEDKLFGPIQEATVGQASWRKGPWRCV